MKRTISAILALTTLVGCLLLSSCGENKDDENTPSKKLSEIDVHDTVNAVCEVLPFDGLVSDFYYKDNDPDEMIKWEYGLYEATCLDKLKDYAITIHSDYNQTLAILVFDETVTDADITEVKEIMTREYIKTRASSLQMYMPDEYDIIQWQLENPEAIWRQYDSTLVLLMYGDKEATAGWEAIDALLK